MNIAPASSYDLARSISEMGDLLKQTTGAAMGLETKLMKASVVEQVENSALGNSLDVTA